MSVAIAGLVALVFWILSAVGIKTITDDWDFGQSIAAAMGLWLLVLLLFVTPARLWHQQSKLLAKYEQSGLLVEFRAAQLYTLPPEPKFNGRLTTLELVITNTDDDPVSIKNYWLEVHGKSEELLPESGILRGHSVKREVVEKLGFPVEPDRVFDVGPFRLQGHESVLKRFAFFNGVIPESGMKEAIVVLIDSRGRRSMIAVVSEGKPLFSKLVESLYA